MFNSSDAIRAVASNKDDSIELTLFRQNGSESGAGAVSESGSQDPPKQPLCEPGPAERGEAVQLREVWIEP